MRKVCVLLRRPVFKAQRNEDVRERSEKASSIPNLSTRWKWASASNSDPFTGMKKASETN
jgi:hypothetical protein